MLDITLDLQRKLDAGGYIDIPPGIYRISATLKIKKAVYVKGYSTQCNRDPEFGTCLIFDKDLTGWELRPDASRPGGARNKFEGLYCKGSGTRATAHGFDCQTTRVKMIDCTFEKFPGDGVHFETHTPNATPGIANCNHFGLQGVAAYACGGNGFHFIGADCNIGLALGCEASSCAGWGFYDELTLGNTFNCCQSDVNVLGQFGIVGNVNRGGLMNCYTESGFAPTFLGPQSYAIGGIHGAGIIGPGTILGFNYNGLELSGLDAARFKMNPAPGWTLAPSYSPTNGWEMKWKRETKVEPKPE